MKVKQDVWHGDSRELCKKLRDNSVTCVITDPPFGVDNQSNSATTAAGKANARKIANDETPEIAIGVFNEVMDALLPKTKADSDLYIFTAHQVLKEWLDVADSLSRHGFTRSSIIVWEKDGPGMGNLDAWGASHEFCIYLKKGKRARTDKRRSGVIHVPQVRPDKLIHPHEKPLALIEMLLRHSTSAGDLAVDPFGGSGTLARACKNLGRSGLSIEYDELNYKRAYEALHAVDQLF
jgi:site-specific DNA-methyltransferase (adenine-specific)